MLYVSALYKSRWESGQSPIRETWDLFVARIFGLVSGKRGKKKKMRNIGTRFHERTRPRRSRFPHFICNAVSADTAARRWIHRDGTSVNKTFTSFGETRSSAWNGTVHKTVRRVHTHTHTHTHTCIHAFEKSRIRIIRLCECNGGVMNVGVRILWESLQRN